MSVTHTHHPVSVPALKPVGKPLAGIACVLVSLGMFGGAAAWFFNLFLMQQLSARPFQVPALAYLVAGLQVFVAVLLAVAGLLFFTASRRARAVAIAAALVFLIELPLLITAFMLLISINQ